MTSKWWWVAALGAVACESADETATAADASVTGDTPALSGDVPGAEDVIETADVPAADDIAAAEDTPGAVDVSIAEDVPGAEDVPVAADIPELADIPGAVDVPEAADIPGAVDVPESPDIPGAVDVGGPQSAGETCLDAIDLEAASSPSGGIDYPYEVSGALGQVNDYNPLIDSGLPPACSLVYDAYGRDKVYVVTLQPGEILEMRATLEPATKPIGLYTFDSCDPVSWPDDDKSGKCGSNEYASKGYCGPVAECDPVELSVLCPEDAPGPRTYWVVVDQVVGDDATGFTLVWNRRPWK